MRRPKNPSQQRPEPRSTIPIARSAHAQTERPGIVPWSLFFSSLKVSNQMTTKHAQISDVPQYTVITPDGVRRTFSGFQRYDVNQFNDNGSHCVAIVTSEGDVDSVWIVYDSIHYRNEFEVFISRRRDEPIKTVHYLFANRERAQHRP